ncbi:hypothetical protein GJAV_G00177410 [Gymnothorax javanicus]|nr:hypothetical protein GJAV_G00177410 [Gymnothorax javanicus]
MTDNSQTADPEPMELGEDVNALDDPWVIVRAEVQWPAEVAESKRVVELEKAVQSLLNALPDKGNCKVLELMKNNEAKVKITPQSVVEALCQIQEMNFKNSNTTAKVHFSPEPSAPPEPTRSPATNQAKALQIASHPGANEKEEVDSGATTLFSQGDIQVEKETINVPLFQYWHITTACSREIDQIQRRNRVDVKAEASVSISASVHKERECSIPRASEEFTVLFQKFAHDINCIPVNISSPLDQGNIMKILEEIQSEESMLVLSVSSKGCQLSGPKESLDRFQKRWSLKSLPQVSEMSLHRTLEIDLQGPLEKQGLSIYPFHWQFISTVFAKQVLAIKQKYGVDFDAVPAGNMLTVKAVSAGHQTFPLTCHALKALEQLYQKGVTDLLDCPPETSSHSKVEQIKSIFQNIHTQNPYVAAGEVSGPWRLVGLPEHLWPAVKEIEEKLGEPVFSQRAKMRMEDMQFLPTVSAAENLAGAAEEEACPVCMCAITEKKKLNCKHEMCLGCFDESVKKWGPRCPVCRDVFGTIEGNQPEGEMTWKTTQTRLPGFPDCGTIEVEYHIPGGIQTSGEIPADLKSARVTPLHKKGKTPKARGSLSGGPQTGLFTRQH